MQHDVSNSKLADEESKVDSTYLALAVPSWLLNEQEVIPAHSAATDDGVDASLASRTAAVLTVPALPPAPQLLAPSEACGAIAAGFAVPRLRIRSVPVPGHPNAASHTHIEVEVRDWRPGSAKDSELDVHLPAAILRCAAVAREVTFTSREPISELHMCQRVFLATGDASEAGADPDWTCIEEHAFTFGFVIPGSTNTWETMLEAHEDGTLPPEMLSGRLLVETTFFDGENLVVQTHARIFYD